MARSAVVKGPPKWKQLILRLDPELLGKIERHRVRLEDRNPGLRVSRHDAICSLLLAALEAADKS